MKSQWPTVAVLMVLVAGGIWLATIVGKKPGGKRAAAPEPKPVPEIQSLIHLTSKSTLRFEKAVDRARKDWQPGYRHSVLNMWQFIRPRRLGKIDKLLAEKTGQNFNRSYNEWQKWSWNQPYEPTPNYREFLQKFYRGFDSRFENYFRETESARIRLDEIQWGGVKRDGIPPLKNPAMLPADKADYLDDSNVVFGIVVGDDVRCYPKRILAWHEMFKDTIGGQSVCGVY